MASKFAAVAGAAVLSNVVATPLPDSGEACLSSTKGATFIQTRSITSVGRTVVELEDEEEPNFLEELDQQQQWNSQIASQQRQQQCPQGCAWCTPVGSSSEVVIESNVEYGASVNMASGQSEPLLMDTYSLRSGLGDGQKRPVVLVIHGGAFKKTSTKKSRLAVKAAKTFAQHGYWVASIEYRRLFEYCLSHQRECWWNSQDQPPLYAHPVHDALAAVRYIHRYAADLGVDPQRIALFGCSAGGITIADALTRDYGEGQSGNAGFPSSIAAGIALSGGMSGASAASHKSARMTIPPFMAFHNAQDRIVPFKLASSTKEFLDSRGSTNQLITIPGSGHCPNVLSGEYLQDMLGFLQFHMRLRGAKCSNGDAEAPVVDPQLPVSVPAPPDSQQSTPVTLAPPVTTAEPLSTTRQTTSNEGSSAATFEPVSGGSNRACRGSHEHGHTGHHYQVLTDSSSLEDCQSRCGSAATCTGVEFFEWGQYKRCKVWTTPIVGSWTLWGSKCFRYAR